jgi:predicted ABC-type ATPase
MTPEFEFWIVAGPNGAGKTTCVQAEPIRNLIPNVRFLNPDDLTKTMLTARGYAGFAETPEVELRAAFIQSANDVEAEVLKLIARRESVGVETVLSTNKYRAFVEETHRCGGAFQLVYVTLANPEIAVRRVAMRVSRGGHDVPVEKIEERFRRSHENLAWFASRADHFWVIDNSGSDPAIPPVLCAFGSHGRLAHLDPASPQHVVDALSKLPVN